MEKRPLISVVTTYYNSVSLGNFVKTSLQCLMNQTYENIELICVNDGSTDTTLEELQYFEKTDSRIKVFTKENEKYAQYSKAYGQEKASGKYIFLFDHDDLIDYDLIEKCFLEFERDPELDIVTPIVKTVFTDGKIKHISNLDLYTDAPSQFVRRKLSGAEAIKKTAGRYDIHIRGLYRAEIFKSFSFRYTEPLLNADEIVERLIFEKARFIGSCKAVYTHYIHADSSAKLPSVKKIDIVRTDVLLRELFKDKGIYEDRKSIFELTAYKNIVNGIKIFHHFSGSMSADQLSKQKNRLSEAYQNLDKKTVLSQFSGFSKLYNAILMASFAGIFTFYRLKRN